MSRQTTALLFGEALVPEIRRQQPFHWGSDGHGLRRIHKQVRLKKGGTMTQAKRRTRGLIALVASAAIALVIHDGLVIPYPKMRAAYLISVGVALWGLIDIVRSLAKA